MEEQVFFPGPYYPRPTIFTVKPEELSSGKSAGSADCAGGSSSGKRVRRRSVKGDEFDHQRVEIQRNPVDPAFHWCYGAPKDYANQLADGSFQQGWLKIQTKELSFPSGMENGHSTWDWSAFERNIQEKGEAAAARAARGERASCALSVVPWSHQTMTIKIGNYYMLTNEEIIVQAIGLADEAGMFKAAVWPKYVQLHSLLGHKPKAEMMNTSSIGLHLVPNL